MAQEIATWEQFSEEMNQPNRDWIALLPPTMNPDKFRACAITAIKQNPDLLRCTTRSLFNAISRAAQDGMMPDGREGFINSYNSKIGKDDNGRDVYGMVAQWQPMAAGFRKRARELDQIIIDAQVVYQDDHFIWHQGDSPSIEHTPARMGQARGDKIGAYAIYKREDGTILHREVMDYGQIEKARAKSKAPDSLMWKDFPEEGYRKTVLRRGIKSVPVSEPMAAIIKRDDEHSFDLENQPPSGIAIPPQPRRSEFKREDDALMLPNPTTSKKPAAKGKEKPPAKEGEKINTEAKTAEPPLHQQTAKTEQQQSTPSSEDEAKAAREADRQDWIKDMYAELDLQSKVTSVADLMTRAIDAGAFTSEEQKAWEKACDDKNKAIMTAARAKR